MSQFLDAFKDVVVRDLKEVTQYHYPSSTVEYDGVTLRLAFGTREESYHVSKELEGTGFTTPSSNTLSVDLTPLLDPPGVVSDYNTRLVVIGEALSTLQSSH